jgi:PD-(D/E)XK nuclease superfamily
MDEITTKDTPWSYSRLTAYESCPRRFHETTLLKGKWPEERSAQLDWGDAVHKALASALRDGTPLPTVFQIFQPLVDRVNDTPGELLVEDDCRWAITKDFQPTPWFSNKVWLRVIADAVKLNEDVALVVDWKTGKSTNADPVQLILTSLVMLVLFPKLQAVRSDFVWLNEDEHTTQVVYRNEAADHWATLLPRVKSLQQAIVDNHFPPKPGRYCAKWCPVKSCEFWGK